MEYQSERKFEICGEEKDKYNSFQVILRPDNVYGFFNKESGLYICRGTVESLDGFLVAGDQDSFDHSECWLKIHDLAPLMQLEDFELYFLSTPYKTFQSVFKVW